MDSTNYRIRGFTGPSADFDFQWYAYTGTLTGDELRLAVLTHLAPDCTWSEAIGAIDAYYLGEDAERSDLRDVESQRVYLFDDEISAAESAEDDNDDRCHRFMVTVDVIK